MFVHVENENLIENLSDSQKSTFDKNNKKINSIIDMSQIVMGECCYVDGNPVDDVWKSFDDTTYNFHFSPQSRDKNKKIEQICEQLAQGIRMKRGRMPWTKNHWWLELEKEEFVYLLAFQSLVYEKSILKCYLDQIQFYKYDKKYLGPNWGSDGGFCMMYPEKNQKSVNPETKTVVVHTGLSLKYSEAKEIVDAFKRFVTL